MSNQTTPGPWEFHPKTTMELPYVIYGDCVLIVESGKDSDARLLSAAPDLFKACAAAMAGFPGWQKMIAAAYTKATGDAP